jgi:hypothetical protein
MSITSRWWYGVALQPITVLLFIGLFALVGTGVLQMAGTFPDAVKLFLLIVVGIPLLVIVIGGFIGGPLFPVALFLDARAVRRADLEWKPNPYLYAVLGLTQLVALIGGRFVPFDRRILFVAAFVIAVVYLYRRHVYVGTP